MSSPIPAFDALVAAVDGASPDATPLARLAAAVTTTAELGDVADQLLGHYVDQARAAGCSWAEIGNELGVSKQAAHQRFPHGRERPWRPHLRRFSHRARHAVRDAAARRASSVIPRSAASTSCSPSPRTTTRSSARALEACGVEPASIRSKLAARLAPTDSGRPGRLGFGTEARTVFKLAVRAALELGHDYIGTEHLLLALVREPDGAAAKVLSELGVAPARVEAEVTRLVGEDAAR